MELPVELAASLAGHAIQPVAGGESGAGVWRCTTGTAPSLYLKRAPLDADVRLDEEAARLRWMGERRLPVPAVHAYGRTADEEYLLMEEIRGAAASERQWASALPEAIAALAEGLRTLHQTSVVDCPFDHCVARRIEEARARVDGGRVRDDDFDEARAGRRPSDLFAELVATVPAHEELVFTHGDFCLPNIILRGGDSGDRIEVAGFIDCGRAGIADRYQDLALAARSIAYNFGEQWVPALFDRYGLSRPRIDKLEFFTLLDEFF